MNREKITDAIKSLLGLLLVVITILAIGVALLIVVTYCADQIDPNREIY